MKRWAIGALAVLGLAGAGLVALLHSLDHVVKAAIEHVGPDVLGVPVRVREVALSAADGRGTLRGIEIGNPPGYAAPRALRAATLTVGLDPASLASDVVTIHDIHVLGPEIAYELREGTNNLDTIRRSIEAYVKRAGGEAGGRSAGAAKAPGRRYVIGRIVLKDAKVTMTGPLLKAGAITFRLPDLELRDVGRRAGGVSAAEAARLFTAALVSRIAQAVLTNAEALRRGGLEGALDALRGLLR